MKTRIIIAVLCITPLVSHANNSDSAMMRPGAPPTAGSLVPSDSVRFQKRITSSTTTEYQYSTCPSGFKSVSTNTSQRISARRGVTTYYINGQYANKVTEPWVWVDDDCWKMERKTETRVSTGSDPNAHKGDPDYIPGSHTSKDTYTVTLERRVTTGNNGTYSYGAWKQVGGKSNCTWTTRWTRPNIGPGDCSIPPGSFVKSWSWNGTYLTITCQAPSC